MAEKKTETSSLQFREEALDNVGFSDTDHMIKIITAKSWITLTTLGAIVIATLIWGFWGTVTIWVEGNGILLPEKGSLYNAVASTGPAHIAKINVGVNQQVKENEILATLETPELANQITITQKYVVGLRAQFEELKRTALLEINDRKETLKKQNQLTERILAIEKENLKSVEELLAMRKEFLKKKLTTNQQYQSTLMRYYDIKNTIERTQSQLLQNELDAENFIDLWKERIKSFSAKVKEEELELETLTEKLKLSQFVRSPITGVVIGIQRSVGDLIQEGEVLLTIATSGKAIDAVIYLAPKDGKRVQAGMGALAVPTTIKKEEYGSITGKVTDVTPFPVTPQSMQTILQNEDLVKRFSRKGAPIAVWVRLEENPETFSQLNWTSSAGPNQEITPGTIMDARIIVRTQNPFSLVIPALKKIIEP
ncbi:MAG: NHLP bacteriocin system secretion protein [Pseudomonadota bacterium]